MLRTVYRPLARRASIQRVIDLSVLQLVLGLGIHSVRTLSLVGLAAVGTGMLVVVVVVVVLCGRGRFVLVGKRRSQDRICTGGRTQMPSLRNDIGIPTWAEMRYAASTYGTRCSGLVLQ